MRALVGAGVYTPSFRISPLTRLGHTNDSWGSSWRGSEPMFPRGESSNEVAKQERELQTILDSFEGGRDSADLREARLLCAT